MHKKHPPSPSQIFTPDLETAFEATSEFVPHMIVAMTGQNSTAQGNGCLPAFLGLLAFCALYLLYTSLFASPHQKCVERLSAAVGGYEAQLENMCDENGE